MRKKLISIISLLLILPLVLTGCGQSIQDADKANVDLQDNEMAEADSLSESAASSKPELDENANLNKAQWAWMISEQFGYSEGEEELAAFYSDVSASDDYYTEIQLCKAFEVFTEENTFAPDTLVSWNYALESAVRAIGTEKLQVEEGELVSFYTQNIADVAADDMDSIITVADAAIILDYAYHYNAEVKLPQTYSHKYNESVYEVSPSAVTLKGDGETAVINNGEHYKEGDVIYVVADSGAAYAIKVTGVQGTEVTYAQAGLEDVYEELRITGTYEPAAITVEGTEDVEVALISDRPDHLVITNKTTDFDKGNEQVGISATKNGVVYTYNKDGIDFKAELSGMKANVDVDYGIFKGLKKAGITVSFDDSVIVNYTMEHQSKTIKLGTATVNLGIPGIDVKVTAVANIGLDGEVTLSYSSSVVADINYRKGSGFSKSVECGNADCDVKAQCTLTAEPTVKVDFLILGLSIANAKVTTGVVAVATVDMDLLGNAPDCIDVLIYVPLRWGINEDGCLITNINKKMKISKTVWDSKSENGPRWHYHWENGTLVEKCTRDKNKVETPPVDEEEQPYDDYNLFNFEEIDFGVITVVAQTIYLKKGESMKIGITSVPDGYSADNLVYTPDNTSVCSVSGGKVTALSSGASTIKISTNDGKYSVFITVIVEAEYNDVSDFKSL